MYRPLAAEFCRSTEEQSILRRDVSGDGLRPDGLAPLLQTHRPPDVDRERPVHPRRQRTRVVVGRSEIVTARQDCHARSRRHGVFEHSIGQRAASVGLRRRRQLEESRRRRLKRRQTRRGPRVAATPEPAHRGASRSKAAPPLSTTMAAGDESSSSSITCASRPCPPPRSTTRPPRKRRRTQRAISQASKNSLRGRQPVWHTARAIR